MNQKMTIEFKGAEFHVEFTYTKPEAPTFYYPGAEAGVSVEEVSHYGGLMNQFFEDMDLWEQLEEAVLVKYEKK